MAGVPQRVTKLEIVDRPNGRQLSGLISRELARLSALQVLNLDGQGLDGEIPTQLGDLANLQTLSLESNLLDGRIPSGLSSLKRLNVLNLSDNYLSGRIPGKLQNLVDNLKTLKLAYNAELNDCIPERLMSVPDNDLAELELEVCGTVATWVSDDPGFDPASLEAGGGAVTVEIRTQELNGTPTPVTAPSVSISGPGLDLTDTLSPCAQGQREIGSYIERCWTVTFEAPPNESTSTANSYEVTVRSDLVQGDPVGEITVAAAPAILEKPAEPETEPEPEPGEVDQGTEPSLPVTTLPLMIGVVLPEIELDYDDDDDDDGDDGAPTQTVSPTPTYGFPTEPLREFRVYLNSGSLNGLQLNGSNPSVSVTPGQAISGTVNLTVINDHDPSAVFPVEATPTWGDHQSSYWRLPISVPGHSTVQSDVTIALTAPSIPGTYAIIFAAQAELSGGYVASGTHWPSGSPQWNNGDDIAGWNASQINFAIANGYLRAPQYGGGLDFAHFGAAAVKIVVAGTAASDRAALVALYNATDGPNWENNTNWLTDEPIGKWYNVTTDSDGRVTGLGLSFNLLTGEIPAELGGLSSLVWLYLSFNLLTGEIPEELGNLSNLTHLRLYSNLLTGEIPEELGNLSNLEELRLNDNLLTGEIPEELGNLSNLEELRLNDNLLTGEIPEELGSLTNLRWLSLYNNHLTGEIPEELGNLSNLALLYLNENQLTGEIPEELGNLSNLTWVDLSTNELTGEIPEELGNLSNLIHLELQGNQLTGEIPEELGNLSNLTWLRLDSNELTGEIPEELGNLSNLVELYLFYNQLTGKIPEELGNLSNLEELRLNDNLLTGEIPAALGDLSNLGDLYLSTNQLTGEIPAALGDLSNLARLHLKDNLLTGQIPEELGNLSNLQDLRLSGNLLTGCIPVGLIEVVDSLNLPDCV